MATLEDREIVGLLEPYLLNDSDLLDRLPELARQFSVYLDLLLRWNARTNLTAIRDPLEIVRRHFGESVFVASVLRKRISPEATLLDFGSGAGFPGLPIQLCCPDLKICLGESQGKKAAFLREAVRALALSSEIWADRVEHLPDHRTFGVVTLRAVDNMNAALNGAEARVQQGGLIAALLGSKPVSHERHIEEAHSLPESAGRQLVLWRV